MSKSPTVDIDTFSAFKQMKDLTHSLMEIDVKNLPDEVLKAVYSSVRQEVDRRRCLSQLTSYKVDALKHRSHSVRSLARLSELDALLSQDWSDLYKGGSDESKFYVYAHVRKTEKLKEVAGLKFGGVPFYIGKGTGDRAWDLKRNEGHGQELKGLLKSGIGKADIVAIVADNLTESQAFELEAKLIYFFGTRFDNRKNGVLVNLEKPKTPSQISWA